MFRNIKKYVAVVAVTLFTQFSWAAQLVNINTADAVAIAENLNGIGASKAQAIVEYRNLHGEFRSVDDLVKVKGIGFKLVERNSELISFGDAAMDSGAVTESVAVPSTSTTGSSSKSPDLVAPAN